ncbi:unnamed protein product [Ixodes pacificus]
MASQLLIRDVKTNDTGAYACKVANSHGKDEMFIKLTVQAPSAKPVDLKVIPLNSTSLRATWKAPSGESKIAGYYVGYKVELDGRSESYVYKTVESRPGVSQECDLKDLRPGTKYTVLVQAYNGKGPGPSSNEVIGETPSSGKLVVNQTSVRKIS